MGCHFEMRKKSPQPFWEAGCRGDLAKGGGLGMGRWEGEGQLRPFRPTSYL